MLVALALLLFTAFLVAAHGLAATGSFSFFFLALVTGFIFVCVVLSDEDNDRHA